MKLTDTQLLDLIEKYCFEVAYQAGLSSGTSVDSYWRIWVNDTSMPLRAATLRQALHLVHTEVVTKLLHPEI